MSSIDFNITNTGSNSYVSDNEYSDSLYQTNLINESVFTAAQEEDETASSSDLHAQLENVQDEQGIIGKLWNGFKNLTERTLPWGF